MIAPLDLPRPWAFSDELPEFGTHLLGMPRQSLEDKELAINRSVGSINYPIDFLLVGSMNPFPCGFFTDPEYDVIL